MQKDDEEFIMFFSLFSPLMMFNFCGVLIVFTYI